MINLEQSISHIYPKAISLVDFVVQDDGKGQCIAEWNLKEPKPTKAQLEKAWKELLAQKEKDDAIEAKKAQTKAYMELVKAELINSFEDVSKDEMIEFTSALAEFDTLGILKLDRYPLANTQVIEWIKAGKLPPL